MYILHNSLFDNHIYTSDVWPMRMDIITEYISHLYGCFSNVEIFHMSAGCGRGLTDVVTWGLGVGDCFHTDLIEKTPFLKEVEKYLCKYKGQEIVEKISKTKDEGGLGLIILTEKLQASQRPESDNIIYEIGIKQMAIFGTNYVGSKAEEIKDIINLLEKNVDEINKFRIRHKTIKPKDKQKIIFP